MKSTNFFLFCSLLAVLIGCQSQPTVIKQEVGTQDHKNRVLVDTRSAFEFAGFHIAGSISLNSGDFLILKNPKTEKRVLDPDLDQIVERLAKRGISPLKQIILLGSSGADTEIQKWRWLLKQLDVRNIEIVSFEDYRARNKNTVPQAVPEAVPVWEVRNPKKIIAAAERCFATWSEGDCQ